MFSSCVFQLVFFGVALFHCTHLLRASDSIVLLQYLEQLASPCAGLFPFPLFVPLVRLLGLQRLSVARDARLCIGAPRCATLRWRWLQKRICRVSRAHATCFGSATRAGDNEFYCCHRPGSLWVPVGMRACCTTGRMGCSGRGLLTCRLRRCFISSAARCASPGPVAFSKSVCAFLPFARVFILVAFTFACVCTRARASVLPACLCARAPHQAAAAAAAAVAVNTHHGIDRALCGTPVLVEPDRRAVVEMVTLPCMAADSSGLIHGGFYFGLADYAAMLAVNDPNVVLGAANCRFLKPVRLGDMLVARAEVESGDAAGAGGGGGAAKRKSVVVEVFVRGTDAAATATVTDGTSSSASSAGAGAAAPGTVVAAAAAAPPPPPSTTTTTTDTKVFAGTFTCFVLPRHVLSKL